MVTEENATYRFTSRNALADGGMIVLLVAGVLCLGAGYSEPVLWELMAGGIICLISCATIYFKKPRSLIAIISDEGIIEHTSKMSRGIISWEEIDDVRIYETFATNNTSKVFKRKDLFIGIFLTDAAGYAKKLNPAQRTLFKLSLDITQAPINIPCTVLGDDADLFVKLCRERIMKKR